jgi:Flp pilus assembly protein TadB
MLQWEGYVTAKVNDDPHKLWRNPFRKRAGRKQQQTMQQQTILQAFPEEDVYEAEDALYTALGRQRKPSEVPIDMLLAFSPYLLTVLAVLDVIGLVQIVAGGFDVSVDHLFGLLVMVLFPVLVFQIVVLQTVRTEARTLADVTPQVARALRAPPVG